VRPDIEHHAAVLGDDVGEDTDDVRGGLDGFRDLVKMGCSL